MQLLKNQPHRAVVAAEVLRVDECVLHARGQRAAISSIISESLIRCVAVGMILQLPWLFACLQLITLSL